jgi:hypothetical protein
MQQAATAAAQTTHRSPNYRQLHFSSSSPSTSDLDSPCLRPGHGFKKPKTQKQKQKKCGACKKKKRTNKQKREEKDHSG